MNILIALPGLPLVAALWFAVTGREDRRAEGWVIALIALFAMTTAAFVESQSLAIPHLLVRGTSVLMLDDASRPVLLLFGGLWLIGALVGRGRSRGPAAVPILIALSAVLTCAIADGRPLVYAAMLATGFGLYAVLATEDKAARQPARALIVILIASDLLIFETLLHATALPEHGIAAGSLLLLGAALALRSGTAPAHVWLPTTLRVASAQTAILLPALPAAAFIGGYRLLPVDSSGLVGLCLGLALVGAVWATVAGVAQRDPRATLGYAMSTTAALLLATLPLIGDPTTAAWTVLSLLGSCATIPLIAIQRAGPVRNGAITAVLLIHGLGGAHTVLNTGPAPAPAQAQAIVTAIAIAATLLLTLSVRRLGEPVAEADSAEISAMTFLLATLAGLGLVFLWREAPIGFVSFWPAPIAITAALVVHQLLPDRGVPVIPPGDWLGPVERTIGRLLSALTALCTESLPRERDRAQRWAVSLWDGTAWASRIARLESLLSVWPATGILMLLIAILMAVLLLV